MVSGPRITASTVDRTEPGVAAYQCTAEGQPLPMIRWLAMNTETGQEEQLVNGMSIMISTSSISQNVAQSTIRIFEDSVFDMLICVAESSGIEVRSNMFVTVTPPGMQLNLHALLF